MDYNNLLLSKNNHVLRITINRPDKLNALNLETMSELKSAFEAVAQDTDVRGIILTGSGDKAFVAGADITQFKQFEPETASGFAQSGQEVFQLIEDSRKPVIAAVNGFALGGGCELAMACHMRVASDNALFGQPEINLGIIPGYGGTQRLTRLVGRARATELMITADMIPADAALKIGLVNHVVVQKDLMEKAEEIMTKIVERPPIQVGYVLDAIKAYYDEGNAYEKEAELFGKCIATEDFHEGVDSFLEKRKPNFKGR